MLTKIYCIKATNIFHAVDKTRKTTVKTSNAFSPSQSTPFAECQFIQEY
jgi:hypothetical protein